MNLITTLSVDEFQSLFFPFEWDEHGFFAEKGKRHGAHLDPMQAIAYYTKRVYGVSHEKAMEP